jgi:hypothetical protein
MQSVTLSLIGDGDDQICGADNLRRHRIGRLCEEAREQGGLLTQEDLVQILILLKQFDDIRAGTWHRRHTI